jgi:2-oxoisovalerate dehydrogenase E2 component (dihydrolipoyl transacylase)
VLQLGGAVGETLAVGSELIRIETADLTPPASRAGAVKQEPPPVVPAREEIQKDAQSPLDSRFRGDNKPAQPHRRPLASPAVRLRAREAGLDLGHVSGSGPAGRVTHEDLAGHLEGPAAPLRGRAANLSTEQIPIIGLRRRIAQRMAEATRRIAHFTYIEEVDVTALEELRAALNAEAGATRPKLTLLPFLMLALVRTLPEFPQMNAHYDDEKNVVTRYGAVHLGIATQTPGGLTVPVVRHVETMSLHAAAADMRRVTEDAREGRGQAKDLSGSTLTITSLGALGGIATTPVINPPEVAIVGVNKISIRPVWRDNAFVPRKMMNLSSSFDHRVIDGWDAASFIQRLRAFLEMPATIFIET